MLEAPDEHVSALVAPAPGDMLQVPCFNEASGQIVCRIGRGDPGVTSRLTLRCGDRPIARPTLRLTGRPIT